MKSLTKKAANYSTFAFDDKNVRVVAKDGEPWFLASDLCDVLGIDITSIRKLDDDEKGLHSMHTLGGSQQMAVVSESGMWTLILRCRDAVKPGTVPYRVRKWVTAEVLPSIRKTGSYGKTPKAKKALPGKITKEQQEAIKQLVMSRGQSLPKEKQAKAMITMWSSLKSHFGCSYKEISEEQFTEALSLAARIPLEGEFIGKSKHNEMSCFDWRMNVHNLNSACIHLDAMYRIWRDEMEPALRLLGSPVATRFCGRIADCYAVTASVKKSLEDAAGLKGLQPF
ncbi:Bro-N domain-containing protein [Escherichia coli]